MEGLLHVRILTPEKEVYAGEVLEVTCTTPEGEISILPRHMRLLSLLDDGIITLKEKTEERYFSAGSGYIETDGKQVRILISRAYGQHELDEAEVRSVREKANELLKQYPDKKGRAEAFGMLRRSSVDLRVLKKVRRRR